MPGCNPLLKDPFNRFWALGIDTSGSLTITLTNTPIARQAGPFLGNPGGVWQLSIDNTESIQLDRRDPPTIQRPLAYIPLIDPNNGGWLLTVTPDGTLQVTSTPIGQLPPDVIPYPPDVSMSIYGDAPPLTPLICATCGNASVTASADLSLWCCTCSSFVPPEDTNIIIVLDE